MPETTRSPSPPPAAEQPVQKKPKVVFRASATTIVRPHPLGIKPSGNALLAGATAQRTKTLGPLLGQLPDEVLMTIIQEITDPKTLLALGHVCKCLYGFCWTDELWKHMVHRYKKEPERWHGSWRNTFWNHDPTETDTAISCKDMLFSDLLYRPFQITQLDYNRIVKRVLEEEPTKGLIPTFPETAMTPEKFAAEGWHNKPFMLDLARPAASWTVSDLVDRFSDVIFRQEYMDWKLQVYNQYMQKNQDEAPLYLFDCRSDAMNGPLKTEYRVPISDVIGDERDYFTALGDLRPDHRWLILGPARSGSSFHKDPNATCAWNSVITGHKYWVMFPPTSGSGNSTNTPGIPASQGPPPGVTTDDEESEVTSPCSIGEWFLSGYYDEARQRDDFLHGVCGPGQMMYVPSGWWHLVVNLDECLALTGNFVPAVKLGLVFDFLKNKYDQISGFKVGKVKRALAAQQDTSSLDVRDFDKDDDDECNDTEVYSKIYSLFYDKLNAYASGKTGINNTSSSTNTALTPEEQEKKQHDIEAALQELARLEKKRASHEHQLNNGGRSDEWQKLVDTAEAGSFSFGFDFE